MKTTPFAILALLAILSGCATTPPSPSTVDPVIACSLGTEAAQASKHALAVQYINACLSRRMPPEQTVMPLRLRARANFELKNFELALKDEEAALQVQKPVEPSPYITLAVYLRALKQYNKSLASLKEASKLDETAPSTEPSMSVPYHTGWTLHEAGRFKDAVAAYSTGIAKQPEFGAAFYRRALSYEALGDKKSAKKDLSRANELPPKEGWPAEVLAKLAEYSLSK